MQRRDAYYRNDPSKYGLNYKRVATRTSFISKSHGYGRSGLLLTCACVIETSSRPRPLHSVGFLWQANKPRWNFGCSPELDSNVSQGNAKILMRFDFRAYKPKINSIHCWKKYFRFWWDMARELCHGLLMFKNFKFFSSHLCCAFFLGFTRETNFFRISQCVIHKIEYSRQRSSDSFL